MKLGIVIPCFNESANIPALINSCNAISEKIECQFLILDNGSFDDTRQILKKYKESNRIKFLRIENNLGYGYGIQTGLQFLESEYVGWMHGDLQIKLEILFTIFPLLKPNCFIKGKRTNRKKVDTLVSKIMGWLVSEILKTRMIDINGLPMIFHRKYLELLRSAPNNFNFDLYAYHSLLKAGIKEVRFATQVFPRAQGESSWNFGFASKFAMSKLVLSYARYLRETSANNSTQN